MFPAIYFVNTNVPQERTQVLLSKKELNELTNGSTNTFWKSDIYWYIDRRNTFFSGGKCSALDTFCYAEFSAFYTFDNKPDHRGKP